MKRSCLLMLTILYCCSLFAQKDIPAIAKEYEEAIENTVYGKNDKAGTYYNFRGFRMYCETYGSGEPLLLIHGNGASINAFVKQIPYFEQHYKVIIADSRAQGRSKDKTDSLTYEMMADDYAALLDAMHMDSVNVIGWSDGGINGILLALRHPQKVKKLMITGANLRPDTTAIEPDVWKRINKTYNMFVKMFDDPKPKKPLDSTVHKYFKLLMEQPNISINELHRIKIPVLVVGGDHDVIKPEHTLEIYKNISNAYLWILPSSGHYTPVVYANEFNAKAEEFFKTPFRKMIDRDRDF